MGRHIKLSHQDIATDLNSSREVISRLMKKMVFEPHIHADFLTGSREPNGDGKKDIFVGFQGQCRTLPDMKANLVFNLKDYEEQWYAF